MDVHKKLSNLKGIPLSRRSIGIDLLFLSLLITPFLSIVDVMWMFSPKIVGEWLTVNTPTSIKIIKDLLIVLLLFYLIRTIKRIPKIHLAIFTFLACILAFESIRLFFLPLPFKAIAALLLAGIRWYIPLFFFPLFQNFEVTKIEITNFLRRYKLVIYVAIILQILQLAFSTRWGECSIDGCRSSGFFAMPQPQALFSLFFLFFAELVILKHHKFQKAISILSIILTKSAAGIIGIAAFVFFKVPKKLKIITLIISILIVSFFPLVTGRPSYWRSPLIRLQLLLDINFNESYFGSYTNVCSNISSIANMAPFTCKTPDSFLISLLGNLSPFIGIMIILIVSYYIWKSRKYYFFIVFGLLLAGGSYTEYFPICIFFPLLLGIKIENKTEESIIKSNY